MLSHDKLYQPYTHVFFVARRTGMRFRPVPISKHTTTIMGLAGVEWLDGMILMGWCCLVGVSTIHMRIMSIFVARRSGYTE